MDKLAAAAIARRIASTETALQLNTIMDNPTLPYSVWSEYFLSDKFSGLNANGSPVFILIKSWASYKNFLNNGFISVSFRDSSAQRPNAGARFTMFGTAEEIESSKELQDAFEKARGGPINNRPGKPKEFDPHYYQFKIEKIFYIGPTGSYVGNISAEDYAAASVSADLCL